MEEPITQKLARLQNRTTCYELVAERDGKRYLVRYVSRIGRQGLIRNICDRGQAIVNWFDLPDTTRFKIKGKGRLGHQAEFDRGDVKVYWSGRTEREAICNGELEFIR